MAILALDCTFGGHSVALLKKKDGAAITRHKPRIHASEGIIDSIDHVLAMAKVTLGDITALACGIGPGNFSGIRAACGVAQGLALVNGLGIALVHSTLAFAHACGTRKALVGYPAHRGHCYLAAYVKIGSRWNERLEPTLYPVDNLPTMDGDWEFCSRNMPGQRNMIAGCISGKLIGALTWRGSLAPAIADLGLTMRDEGVLVSPVDARPLYVRNKVALTIAERKEKASS